MTLREEFKEILQKWCELDGDDLEAVLDELVKAVMHLMRGLL